MFARLLPALVTVGIAITTLVLAWPQLFGVARAPVVAQVVALRGLGIVVALVLVVTFTLFALLAPDLERRQQLIAHLGEHAIRAVFHYVPLHSSPVGLGFGERHLPNTDQISDRLVRLPLFPTLDDHQQSRVIDAVRRF